MAKSLRSKAKRAHRAKKRETGIYAATEAARLHRLNAKLAEIITSGGDVQPTNEPREEIGSAAACSSGEGHEGAGLKPYVANVGPMVVDSEKLARISTHGYRNSQREEWRLSKGSSARPHRGGKGGRHKRRNLTKK